MNDGNAVRQGLEASLPVLRRYARKLYRYRHAEVEDLIQATVERSLVKAHLWQPGTNLDGWLLAVMHSVFINQIRREIRQGEMNKESLNELRHAAVDSPEIGLVVRDLRRALAAMDARQIRDRQALSSKGSWSQIVLRIARGDSYTEVARDLDIPVGTVRSRLNRAKAELRQSMDRGQRSPRP